MAFHRVAGEAGKRFKTKTEGRNFKDNRAEYFGLLDSFVRTPTPALANKLNEFSLHTGKGSHEVETNLSVMLMELLRRRQLHEALGIVLWCGYSNDFARTLAMACGLDWETLFLGTLAHDGSGKTRRVEELVIHGSDASLRLLVAYEKAHPGANWEALRSLIDPSPGGTKIPLSKDASRAKSAPQDVQTELISIAPQCFALNRHRWSVDALRTIGSLRRREFAESWQALAWHVSDKVAMQARSMLLDMEIEPRPPQMAIFHVTKNGEPVANTELFFDFFSKNDGQYSDLDERRKSVGTTDETGDLKIWKSPMTTGRSLPTTIRIFKRGSVIGAANVGATYWALDWWQPQIKERGWVLRIPVPADLSAPIHVEVQTYDVSFRVVANLARVAGKTATISLSGDNESPLKGVFKVPAEEVMTIPELLEGNYRATLNVPGIVEWSSGPFRVGPGIQPILVRPEPGTDLRVSIVPPGTDRPMVAYQLHRKNGPPNWIPNSETRGGVRTFYGLEKGDYILRIPTPDEWPFDVPKTVPNYRRRDIPFQVTSKTPPVLSLGLIKLKAAK